MKRSPSASSPSPPPQPTTPSPQSPKKPKIAPSPPEKGTSKGPPGPDTLQNGEWTADKREIFMDRIIANGYKATDLGQLANELGMTKKQFVNQLQPGRKGSFRDKAVKVVKGE